MARTRPCFGLRVLLVGAAARRIAHVVPLIYVVHNMLYQSRDEAGELRSLIFHLFFLDMTIAAGINGMIWRKVGRGGVMWCQV